MQPRVSVVIPSLAGDVSKARASLERQTVRDWDLVTITGVRPVGRARNMGTRQTTGDLILFLDDDAELGNDLVLERMLAAMRRPDIAVVGSSKILPNTSNRLQQRIAKEVPRWVFPILDTPLESNPPLDAYGYGAATTTCCLIRRDVLERLGGFSEHLPTGQDTELFYRIRRAGYRFVIPADCWTYHSPPGSLKTFVVKCFRYGGGHAREARLEPSRRMDLIPLDEPRGWIALAAIPILFPATIFFDIRLLPRLRVRPAFRPIQALARLVTVLGYAWAYVTWTRPPTDE